VTAQKNPVPRANAGSRANSKIERDQDRPSAADLEAAAAASWLAERFPMPAALARALAALATLGRALG
jgi:hypothetical protein